jgi:hypothetical protein
MAWKLKIMTNPELTTELRSMLESIAIEAARGLSLAELSPPPTEEDRESIKREFEVIRARMWADLCRGITLSEEVEQSAGLTDENQRLIERFRELHDNIMAGGHGHV